MLCRFRRFRPIARNALAALVKKQIGVSFASVQFGKIFRDHDAFSIRPRASADSTAGVGRLVAIVGIPLHAQVGVPSLVAETHCACEFLANTVCARSPPRLAVLLLALLTKKLMAGLVWALSAPMLWSL